MSGWSGFDEREPDFAIGSVTGARWWNLQVRDNGNSLEELNLTGVSDSWKPGENTARCLRYPGVSGEHEAPGENCSCGFWAYWKVPDNPNPHGFSMPVLGVIEGYGKTLIGDKGFRCARARITALHIAGDLAAVQMSVNTRFGRVNFSTAGAMRTWRAICGRREYRRPDPDEALASQAAREILLGDRYGVPVYATRDSMLALHPPTRDYLPPGKQIALPVRRALTAAEAMARVQAMAGPGQAMLEVQHAARGLRSRAPDDEEPR